MAKYPKIETIDSKMMAQLKVQVARKVKRAKGYP